jgi:ornithine carbamoyltransferase
MTRHLLSIGDLDQAEFTDLIARAVAFASGHGSARQRLAGRSVGIYFRKPSTRTRTSFAVATVRLGGVPIMYGPADLQTNTGESTEDTVRVLSEYLDALVVRTAANPGELRTMASSGNLPIVNAMTADEHPTQAISDFAMMKRHFGRLEGLRVLYFGEGNNTAAALALAASRIAGIELVLLTPDGYGVEPPILARAAELSGELGGQVSEQHAVTEAEGLFDVLYTTRWQTTGTEKDDLLWRERFAPLRVTTALMQRFGNGPSAVFMHDLPAVRGEDCDSAVLDGPQSIAFAQAAQKLYTAMAVLDWCVED